MPLPSVGIGWPRRFALARGSRAICPSGHLRATEFDGSPTADPQSETEAVTRRPLQQFVLAAAFVSALGCSASSSDAPRSTTAATPAQPAFIDDLTLSTSRTSDTSLCAAAAAPSIGLNVERTCLDASPETLMSILVSTPVQVSGREQSFQLLASVHDVNVESVWQEDRALPWQQEGTAVGVLSPKSFAVSPLTVRLVVGGYPVECSFELLPTPCDVTSIPNTGTSSTDAEA